jgi:hypothetical protein
MQPAASPVYLMRDSSIDRSGWPQLLKQPSRARALCARTVASQPPGSQHSSDDPICDGLAQHHHHVFRSRERSIAGWTQLGFYRGPHLCTWQVRAPALTHGAPTNRALSVERPETPPTPSCFVPFRRDPDFVERTALLDQICKKCSTPASRVALVGLGGVG